jgi:outer membrane protein TolC
MRFNCRPGTIFKSLPVFLFTIIFNISAQTNTDSVITLNINQVIDLALKNNYDVKLARKDVERAESQIDEAYSSVWPSINGTAEYNRNIKSPVLFLPPNTPFNPSSSPQTISLGADNSYNISASLNQTLFSLKVNTAISIANDYYNFYKYSEKSTEDEVIFRAKQAFYGALLARELIEVSRQSYEVAKVNFENVQSQYKQGVSSEYDFLRAEVQLANVNPVLIQAQNNYEMTKNSLKNLLAIDLNQKIEIVGDFTLEPVDPIMLKESEDLLLENNPTLTALGFQSSVLDKNIRLERAEYFPSLSAFASYIWQTQDNTFDFSNYFWANTITVGLRLSIPVFDGFRRNARIEQAIISKEQLDLTRSKAAEGLRIQLVQAQLKMQEAKERVLAQEKSLKQARRAVEIAQSRYKNGIGTQLEILDTQSSLTQTQTNYSQAIYDYLISKAQWENVVGSSKKQ